MVPNERQIKAAVMHGQRPDLNAVTGPENEMLVMRIKDCISRCWQQLPDDRPSFAGKNNVMWYFYSHCSIDLS